MRKFVKKHLNLTNIFVAGGFTTYALLVYNKFKKKETLNDPIIKEFLRIVENDEKMRQMVGLPISINNGVISSLFISNNKDDSFAEIYLPIKGKNGSFNVKIYGNSLKQKEIINSEKKSYYQKEYYIPELKILERLKNLQNQNEELKNKNIDLEKELLLEEDVFWRIEMLEITKKSGLKTSEAFSIKIPEILSTENKNYFTRRNLKDLLNYEKKREEYFNSLKFPDSHLDYKYKRKMEEIMKKRFFLINSFAVCGFLFYFWFATKGKNRQFKPLAHSDVVKKSKNLVAIFLKNKGLGNVNFNETIMGGLYSESANCSIFFNGKNFYGKAYFKVNFDNINYEFQESRIDYYLMNKNGDEEFYQKSL